MTECQEEEEEEEERTNRDCNSRSTNVAKLCCSL